MVGKFCLKTFDKMSKSHSPGQPSPPIGTTACKPQWLRSVLLNTVVSSEGLFGYARPGRFGLGHSLLAWARCFLWCQDNHAAMVAPRWLQVRLGPYLRREMDKRSYHKLFRRNTYLHGWRRLWLLLFATRFLAERESQARVGHGARLVIFENDVHDNTRFFRAIFARHQEVLSELLRIARAEQIPETYAHDTFIGIHVRMGDFTAVTDPSAFSTTSNAQLPLTWYRDMLLSIRRQAGHEFHARVFSDGDAKALRPLLQLSNVSLASPYSALYDILALSQAIAIISSGSGFSMWAAYLGQVPRVCFPEKRREYVVVSSGTTELEPECAIGSEVPAAFVAHLLNAYHPSAIVTQPS